MVVAGGIDSRPGRPGPFFRLAGLALTVCALSACLPLAAAGASPERGALRQGGTRAADQDGSGVLAGLPVGLRAVASSTLGAGLPQFLASARAGALVAHGGGLATVFSRSGPSIRTAGACALQLAKVGRGRRLVSAGAAIPVAARNQVTYRRGALSEWYRNGPLGLEQGFTFVRPPRGDGPLTVVVRSSGSLPPRRLGEQFVLAASGGRVVASYGGLSALDATGARCRPGSAWQAASWSFASTTSVHATRSRSTPSSSRAAS